MPIVNDIKIDPNAMVCRGAVLQGDITIGAGSIVHPTAQILAVSGPIHIGENNIIEEQVKIQNETQDDSNAGSVTVIGDNNVFEVGSQFLGTCAGHNNVFEAHSVIGPQMQVASQCFVGAASVVDFEPLLDDHMIVSHGGERRRIDTSYVKSSVYTEIAEHLRQNLSKFHTMQK